MSDEKKSAVAETPVEKTTPKTSKVKSPTVKEMFQAGSQFGHETRRWNPKMKKYIFSSRNNIHILDISKTEELLKKAVDFLSDASSRGPVIFVGTKRQASEIIKNAAIESGAHFVNVRWAGGILTNFKEVKKSLIKLNNLEKGFEEGVEGRTKYEVSRMKKEWQRLDRLYSGIKTLEIKPTAVIVVDASYEKAAIRECRHLGIPVVAIVDTNTDPDLVDYVIPANDDAIGSITLIIKTLADAVKEGNGGKGLKHNLKDYLRAEVNIIKKVSEEEKEEKAAELKTAEMEEKPVVAARTQTASPKTKSSGSKGILERVQEAKKPVAKKTAKK